MGGGGLVTAFILKLGPLAKGAGTSAAIEAYHQHGGRLPLKVALTKLIASITTLGCCGSGGREGPIAMICSGINATMAEKLNLSSRDRRLLMAAGISGGVGAYSKRHSLARSLPLNACTQIVK